MNDTIFALATAPGRAAVAVMRISGPGVGAIARALAGDVPPPRRAALREIRTTDGDLLDEALLLHFPGPRSFTGEDVLEVQTHGGPAVVAALTDALWALGARPAEPGEFTRRAFQNGRLDLAQAEAVADLVDAETVSQRRQALAQLGGAIGERHRGWRDGLLRTLALLEAEIDFPDEGLPGALAERARPLISGLAGEMEAAVRDSGRGERVREGFRVAVIGPPNAGKSTLLNALLGRDAAIVTQTPGTTRDVIEAPLDVSGYRLVLADTAGMRGSTDPIEQEGVRRAKAWAAGADLRLLLVDGSSAGEEWRTAASEVRSGDLCILTKDDLRQGPAASAAHKWAQTAGISTIQASLQTPGGVASVQAALREIVVERLAGGDFPATTRLRHRAMLIEAASHLRRGETSLEVGPELAAEDVRLAARALARVTGEVGSEAVLGEIFAAFCIGK